MAFKTGTLMIFKNSLAAAGLLLALTSLAGCGSETEVPVASDDTPQAPARLTVEQVSTAIQEGPEGGDVDNADCLATAVVNADFSDAFVTDFAESNGLYLNTLMEKYYTEDGSPVDEVEGFSSEDVAAFGSVEFQDAFGQCILDRGADAAECIEGSNTYGEGTNESAETTACESAEGENSFEQDSGYQNRYGSEEETEPENPDYTSRY